MMRNRVQDIRYGIGDAMGNYAPDYFRRSRNSTSEILIGAGSVLAALGIGYLVTRLSDRRMGRLIDRLALKQGLSPNKESNTERHTVHGTSGAKIPNTDRATNRETRSRAARAAVHQSDGAEWPKSQEGSRS